MAFKLAWVVAALAVSFPAAAQRTGTVTYDVDMGNVDYVTINYTNRTIRETYDDGSYFTKNDSQMDFDAYSRWVEQTYGDGREGPGGIETE